MWRIAILVGLAGCGRLGFEGANGLQVDGDGGVVVPHDEIAVSVLGNLAAYGGATVLVDRGGVYDRLTTDESGVAVFRATEPTTFHVVYGNDFTWTILTAVDVDGGTEVVFGGGPHRPGGTLSTKMTLTVPAYPNASKYLVTGPQCIRRTFSASTTQAFTFMGDCAGRTVHMYATAFDAGNVTIAYMDLGDVMLVDNGTVTGTGAWAAVPSYTLNIHGLPAGATNVAVELTALAADRDDYTDLEATFAQIAPASGGAATWTRSFMPIANAMWLSAGSADPTTYSTLVATPAIAPGTTAIDASMMLPFLGSLTHLTPPDASWSAPNVGAADLVLFYGGLEAAPMIFITWEVIAPPTLTHVTFPQLPSDLVRVDPAQMVWDNAGAMLIDVAGMDRAGAMRLADGFWNAWEYTAQSIPVGGAAVSRVYWQLAP